MRDASPEAVVPAGVDDAAAVSDSDVDPAAAHARRPLLVVSNDPRQTRGRRLDLTSRGLTDVRKHFVSVARIFYRTVVAFAEAHGDDSTSWRKECRGLVASFRRRQVPRSPLRRGNRIA